MISGCIAFLAFGLLAAADVTVYAPGTGALASGFQSWSWSSTLDFASTAGPGGIESISVDSEAWAALSIWSSTPFANSYAGLQFDISGAQPDVSLYLSSSTDSDSSPSWPLTTMTSTPVNTSAFTTVLVNFANLPGNSGLLANDSWDLIDFQGGADGASYFITNIVLLSEIVVEPEILSAEPMPGNVLAVTTQGAVNFTSLSAKLNGRTVHLTKGATYSPWDTPAQTITYFTLSQPLTAGSLVISAGNSTVSNFTIPEPKVGSISLLNTKPISPLVYGVNFPTSAAYIELLGVTISRWGGNAVTAYNPDGAFTNAGNDWYFENRVSVPDAPTFLSFVKEGGSKILLTIPALDWVAKDATSYSYPKTVYPEQEAFDPYLADAGDGLFPNGSAVTPPMQQSNVYTPWNTSMAAAWLAGLSIKPDFVAVDNEIEIASSTHQDMHPDPMGYDEELQRVINTAIAAKGVLPDVTVIAPSTCAWWFYWTSEIGYTDNAAHGGEDFLPWFLSQMQNASTTAGKRLLDYLDVHYYFAADTSANDAAAKALRLRMTRSWWDPTYTDESYIGTSVPAQWNESNPNAVMLIPRMQQLIKEHYPGTKFSVSEWSSTDDTDITGGLVTVDSLGIFGREGLDSATYWDTPDQLGPIGLAFWLFRGNGTFFGDLSVPINVTDNDPDVLGIYASTSANRKVSVVIVNKDVVPVNIAVSNLPTGTYFLRHFGGAAGVAKWQTTIHISAGSNLVVPSYAAVFLQQQ